MGTGWWEAMRARTFLHFLESSAHSWPTARKAEGQVKPRPVLFPAFCHPQINATLNTDSSADNPA